MRDHFKIYVEWEGKDAGSACERETFVSLEVVAGVGVLTEVEDSYFNSTRSKIRVSTLPLAHWFAGNFWRLLYEPERQEHGWRYIHFMGAAGQEYAC